MLAIGLVLALIGALNLAFGSDPDSPGPAVVSQGEPEPSASPTPSSAFPVPVATPPASGPASPTLSASPIATSSEPAAPLRAPLRVYNYSRRTGLARRAAAEYERRGWQVVEVANTRVRTEVTTVYYAPGQEAVAAQLREEFPAIRASAPRPAELEGEGLTVVVTREYPA